jgi:hypothetical protein
VSGTYLARGAGDLAKTIYNLREHLWSRLGSNQSPRRANALNGPRRPSRVTGRLGDSNAVCGFVCGAQERRGDIEPVELVSLLLQSEFT